MWAVHPLSAERLFGLNGQIEGGSDNESRGGENESEQSGTKELWKIVIYQDARSVVSDDDNVKNSQRRPSRPGVAVVDGNWQWHKVHLLKYCT